MSIGKLQNMGGNFVSRLGGADILKQDELSKLDPQQLMAYNQQKEAAKNLGMRELSARLSDAFGGRDVTARAAQRKAIQQGEEEKRKAEEQMQVFKDVSKNISAKDYASNKEYYTALGKSYLSKGFADQGIKFLELGKPTTATDLTKQLISSRKDEQKTFNAVKSGVDNFKQIMDAAESEGGAASYALMVKFIKQLDDSVVKEGEVRTFGDFQGLAANFKNAVNKAEGKGFTGETKAEILNLARQTVDRLIKDYNDYRGGTDIFYNQIGLSPELLFSGLELNTEGLDLGKTYTAQDFETIDVLD
jgi:hypothetical protein